MLMVVVVAHSPSWQSPISSPPGDANQDNAYEVTVVATDNDGQTASRDVTVRVTNVEEAWDSNPFVGAATGWSFDNSVRNRS